MGQLDEGIALVAPVEAELPRTLGTYLKSAAALRDAGRLDAADAAFAEAVAAYPDDKTALSAWVDCAMRRCNWPEMAHRSETMRKSFPEEPRGYALGGRAFLELDRQAEAEAVLAEGALRFPDDREVLFHRALSAFRRRDWVEAVPRSMRLLEVFPDFSLAYVFSGRALLEAGDYDAAEPLLLEAVRRSPDDPGVFASWASRPERQRDWAEAARRWAEMRGRFADHLVGYARGGEALQQAGRHDEADILLTDAAERFPEDAGCVTAWAECAMRRGDWNEATRRWSKLRQRFPDRVAGFASGVKALFAAGRYEDAEVLLAEAERRFPGDRVLADLGMESSRRRAEGADRERRLSKAPVIFPEASGGFPIEFRDGAYCVRLAADRFAPVHMRGEPVRNLAPDWRAQRAYLTKGLASLSLRHATGNRATWYLDERLNYLTDDLTKLDSERRSRLVDACRTDFERLWETAICCPEPSLGGHNPSIDPLTRMNLATEVVKARESGLAIVLDQPVVAGPWRLAGDAAVITPERARATLSADYLALSVAALSQGEITVPSPFSGERCATARAIPLSYAVFAYRYYDPSAELVFYVLASAWKTEFLGLYVPAADLEIYPDADSRRVLLEWLTKPIRQAFAEHVAQYGEELAEYLAGAPAGCALVYYEGHLGHHLWNELTGLDVVVNEIAPERLPRVILVRAAATEMWGKIDTLFPELTGHVDRSVETAPQLIEPAYRHRLLLLRPCTTYVSRGFAARVIDLSERHAAAERVEYERLRAEGYRFVMLGLRVENRTVVDLCALFREVIAYLHRRLGRLAVIIDGHNGSAQEGAAGTFRSHWEDRATRSPPEVEREILEALRVDFAGVADLRVLDTIGAPVSASIFWCNRSEFFVTPWGAGLAKYRWVCNCPGVITGGPTFLRFGGDVHLYDSEEFMEAPSAVRFNAPEDAEDAPDAPMLIGIPSPDRQNYRIRTTAVLEAIGALLDDLQRPTASEPDRDFPIMARQPFERNELGDAARLWELARDRFPEDP